MIYLGMLALATGLGLPIAVIGAGLGQGRAVAAGLEGMARQPEASGTIQTAMIIGLAFIEALVIYALVMFFILSGKLPGVSDAVALANAEHGGAATTAVR
jgi:F-type H+-transporting ATPase subunit c